MNASLQPYPGLRPFLREETDIFFGREKQTDELLKKLSRRRFVAIVGPSGCGKSSLARAGLVAGLETGYITDAGAHWRVATLRPGLHPIKRLGVALLKTSEIGPVSLDELGKMTLEEEVQEVALLDSELRRGPLSLVQLLRDSPMPPKCNLLVLVDQFEEIFRFRSEGGRDEADAFVELLLQSTRQRAVPIFVVLTMRSDYLGDCALFADLPEAINEGQYLTPRLTREQCREVIQLPAKVFDGEVEAELINTLLNDIGRDPDQLPLLQHVLRRMWTQATDGGVQVEGREGPLLGNTDYEAAGGLSGALSIHADEAYGDLDDEQQPIAQALFRALCERREQRDSRRPATLKDIADSISRRTGEVLEVVEVFRRPDRCFITPEASEPVYPNTVLDIGHESLIRQWVRLSKWVEAEARSAWTYRHLAQTAQLWSEGKAALWGTPNLENALSWEEAERPTRAWAKRYGGDFKLAIRFLRASEAEREKQARDADKHRRKELRRARSVALTMGALFVLAAAALLFGWAKNRQAIQQGRLANARAIAAAALNSTDREPERSLLLALEAAFSLRQVEEPVPAEIEHAIHQALESSRARLQLTGHQGRVLSAAFSPDGLQLLTGGDNAARIWDAYSGSAHLEFAHLDGAQSVAFSPDGTRFATAGWNDEVVHIRDSKQGNELLELPEHSGGATFVAFSPRGDLLASAGQDGLVRLWDAVSGEQLLELLPPGDPALQLEFDPLGERLAVALGAPGIKLFQTATGELLQELKPEFEVWDVAFSPLGGQVAAVGTSGDVALWDGDDFVRSSQFELHSNSISSVTYTPEGRYLVTTSYDGTAKALDRRTEEAITLCGHAGWLTGAAVAPDGTRLATTATDGIVKIWDLGPSDEPLTVTGLSPEYFDLEISRDGSRLAAVEDGQLILMDPLSGRELLTGSGRTGTFDSSFSNSGMHLAIGNGDGSVQIVDARSGSIVQSLEHPYEPVLSVEFDPKDTLLATAGSGPDVVIWDLESGEKVRVLEGHDDNVWEARFSPDGEFLATAGRDRQVKIWNLESGEVEYAYTEPENWISSLAFSPDGEQFATANRDGLARIRRTADGKMLFSLVGHRAGLTDIAYSPDGERLITTSMDKSTLVWDAKTGRELFALSQNEGMRSVAFGPQGKYVATAGAAGLRVRVFDLGELLRLARRRVSRTLTEDECQRFLYQDGCPLSTDALGLYLEGRTLAGEGNLDLAIEQFEKATALFPAFDLDPRGEATDLAARSWMERGQGQMHRGANDDAIGSFREALGFDADNEEIGSKIEFAIVAAGLRLFEAGEILESQQVLRLAKELSPEITISSSLWNGICWRGSLRGLASEVMESCEKAVAPDPLRANHRDSRGLARALTGDFEGAIEDFLVFVNADRDPGEKAQRERWIGELKEGRSPFTPQELRSLGSN